MRMIPRFINFTRSRTDTKDDHYIVPESETRSETRTKYNHLAHLIRFVKTLTGTLDAMSPDTLDNQAQDPGRGKHIVPRLLADPDNQRHLLILCWEASR